MSRYAAWSRLALLLLVLGLGVACRAPERPDGTALTITVELGDGRVVVMTAAGAADTTGAATPVTIAGAGDAAYRFVSFTVTNSGTEPHQFVVITTDHDPAALPIERDRVRLTSPPDAPNLGVLYPEGIQFGPGNGRANWATIQPGDQLTAIVGQSSAADDAELILLCNLPGHYERGEYAVVMVGQ